MNLFPCIFVEQLKLSILAFYANRVILTELFFFGFTESGSTSEHEMCLRMSLSVSVYPPIVLHKGYGKEEEEEEEKEEGFRRGC